MSMPPPQNLCGVDSKTMHAAMDLKDLIDFTWHELLEKYSRLINKLTYLLPVDPMIDVNFVQEIFSGEDDYLGQTQW